MIYPARANGTLPSICPASTTECINLKRGKKRLPESSCKLWIYFVNNLENVMAADFNFFGKCICRHYDPLALVLISQRKSTSEKGLEQENIAIYISYKLARFPWSLLLFISLWCFIRMDNIFSETRLYIFSSGVDIFLFQELVFFISGVDIFLISGLDIFLISRVASFLFQEFRNAFIATCTFC